MRTISIKCMHCAQSLSITSDLPVEEMVRRLEAAHDLLSPHCSRLKKP